VNRRTFLFSSLSASLALMPRRLLQNVSNFVISDISYATFLPVRRNETTAAPKLNFNSDELTPLVVPMNSTDPLMINVNLLRSGVVPVGLSVRIRSINELGGPGVLGDSQIGFVRNPALPGFPLSLQFDKPTITSIGKYKTDFVWEFLDGNNWQEFGRTEHIIYAIISRPPSWPWITDWSSDKSSSVLWTEVLDLSCDWANGCKNVDDAAASITRNIYKIAGEPSKDDPNHPVFGYSEGFEAGYTVPTLYRPETNLLKYNQFLLTSFLKRN
jgi:hypothetical protein